MITCCKDCKPPTRCIGCHVTCNKYLEEKAKLKEEKKLIHKNKEQYKEQNYAIYSDNSETLAYMHKYYNYNKDKYYK